MSSPIDLPIVRLTASQFWKDDFPFSIFTIRHNSESYPHQYCRNFWKIIYVIAGHGAEVIDGVAYDLQPVDAIGASLGREEVGRRYGRFARINIIHTTREVAALHDRRHDRIVATFTILAEVR